MRRLTNDRPVFSLERDPNDEYNCSCQTLQMKNLVMSPAGGSKHDELTQ